MPRTISPPPVSQNSCVTLTAATTTPSGPAARPCWPQSENSSSLSTITTRQPTRARDELLDPLASAEKLRALIVLFVPLVRPHPQRLGRGEHTLGKAAREKLIWRAPPRRFT